MLFLFIMLSRGHQTRQSNMYPSGSFQSLDISDHWEARVGTDPTASPPASASTRRVQTLQ